MKKAFLILTGITLSSVGTAQAATAEANVNSKDVCLYAGKPYSIGAQVGGKVCTESSVQVFVPPASGGVAVKESDPPHWESVVKHTAKSPN
ncbi:exported protein of unknown function [Pararobbsia alpina]|uniref:hypothetical protein n=1 Tax=Pararobbsia alpina TaxID=621374 RepID=UPI0039A74788